MIGKKEGRWGTCEYFLKDEYVGRSIHNYGEYNPDETEKIIELATESLNKDETRAQYCLDIGANIGCISQALKANGFNIMPFEPQPEINAVMHRNVNNATSSGFVGQGTRLMNPVAVGNPELGSTSFVRMPKVYYSEKGNFGGLGIGTHGRLGTYEVPLVSIDELNKGWNIRVCFMKIDVEGYELEVLKGATSTILAHKPIMYIEDDRIEKRQALRDYIRELGYSIEPHFPTLYRENNFFGLKKNIWDKDYASHNLICRPK